MAQSEGALVSALSDGHITVHDDKGLNIDEIERHLKAKGSLKGAAEAGSGTLLAAACDAIILTTAVDALTAESVEALQARVLIEVTPWAVPLALADKVRHKGVLVIPDILTQAGVVTAQYAEWVQDIQSFFWEDHEVNQKLEYLLNACLRAVFAEAEKVDGDLRMASHIIAVRRVAEALKLRGIYP
jgi:glutamate dehydrogenase/leucine dehydrogenase